MAVIVFVRHWQYFSTFWRHNIEFVATSDMFNVQHNLQGRRSSGLGVQTPWKYVGGVRVCFDPLKMSHSFIQNFCCITASFTTSKMNSWTLILLMLTMLPSLRLINSKKTVSSNQCLCCSTELKLSWPKTKLQNVGADDAPSKILIDGVPVEGVA